MTPARDISARQRTHEILDEGSTHRAAIVARRALIVVILASVAAVTLETDRDIQARFGGLFLAIEIVAATIFTIEYALRLWSAPEYPPCAHLGAWSARWAYARSPTAIIDLLSVAPFYLGLFFPTDLRVLALFRLLRFFKLARYSPGMNSLVATLVAERKALMACAIVLFGLVLVAAAAMHIVEQSAQPDKFGSIPSSMWWAIVTLTTVGYGDVVPVTLFGRIVASFTMLAGMMMLALPVGIVATAFAEEIHKREFVVSWGMVARVPLFASLPATDIGEVMNCLRAQTVPSDTVIVRKGETANRMYLIAAGEVTVDTPQGEVTLSEGHFFGEMALLRQARRNATVRSTKPTKLLALEAADLRALMERDPEIARRIEAIAAERLAAAPPSDAPLNLHDQTVT